MVSRERIGGGGLVVGFTASISTATRTRIRASLSLLEIVIRSPFLHGNMLVAGCMALKVMLQDKMLVEPERLLPSLLISPSHHPY